jgi:hypothetical protein
MREIAKPSDAEILSLIRATTAGLMTYVVRNMLEMAPRPEWGAIHKRGYRKLDIAFVRRRLMAMEKAGKVRRVPSSYATQICWSAVSRPEFATPSPIPAYRLSGPSA